MYSLIGVHGVGNHFADIAPSVASDRLATVWRGALESGYTGRLVDQLSVSAAYYAHHLQEPGRQSNPEDIEDLPNEARVIACRWFDSWAVKPLGQQGIGTVPLRQAIGMVSRYIGLDSRLAETFLAVFFREVAAYLDGNNTRRSAARYAVANAIASSRRPRAVLAHSLGSIIAYEALAAYPAIEVDVFVTLGSPLGLFMDRLDPADGRRPQGVRQWVDVADRGDLIAVPRGAVAKQFAGVVHHPDVTVHWADFHLVRNYLGTRAVADILYAFIHEK